MTFFLRTGLACPALIEAKENMRRVDYDMQSRVDVLKLGDSDLGETERENIFKDLATRKGKDWEHEKEIRWLYHPDLGIKDAKRRLQDGKMKVFIPLPHTCLPKVTLGYRSSVSLLETVLQIKNQKRAKWEVAKTKLSLNSFQFEDELVLV